MSSLKTHREQIRAYHLKDENVVLNELITATALSHDSRKAATLRAVDLVKSIRSDDSPGLMEVFLAEYGLSTDEGVALMCLAEALLRVPDPETIDALIEDKIAPSSWGEHLGKSSSSLVNASTWGLMLTGKILQGGEGGIGKLLKEMVKRLGEPTIRAAVTHAMKEMGAQFVLGETIEQAIARGRNMEKKGYTYSYDMLGEAALTAADADGFFEAYEQAIDRLGQVAKSSETSQNPGISIKLSALHPRYEAPKKKRVMDELVPRTLALAKMAKARNLGFNIDAEEADRLDLSLDVIEAVLSNDELAGWDGFGVVVQTYCQRAGKVLDWLYALAEHHDRKIMVRLVKGAYWDSEIKRAQAEGLKGFPVFTQKTATDISYICCAAKLLAMTDRVYPQFATHNAHTVASIIELAGGKTDYEFQRLHGMGESLHQKTLETYATRCRIYAPVGAHRDLLAYLVRRLLENGANSSFVNQIVDETVPPRIVAEDPFTAFDPQIPNRAIVLPVDLYGTERPNSQGWDLHSEEDVRDIEDARRPFKDTHWQAGPMIAGKPRGGEAHKIVNPADPADDVGNVTFSSLEDVAQALDAALSWDAPAQSRADVLRAVADLYEKNFGELFALLTREAGKTPLDAIAELREAVDFLRYYAQRGCEVSNPARGVFTCISPWNFPLAIFTGQIAAALAAGNAVLSKPAETTTLSAAFAVSLMHEAGVPRTALQLLPGQGGVVGTCLTSDGRVNGVCFTGSTATAQNINRAMSEEISPSAPLIAETGGLNAMIVDSTALPEQAIKDVIASAFQSAGQRCSALRVLYVQEDVLETFSEMLYGAMDELDVGNPWQFETDVGPVINQAAKGQIDAHIEKAKSEGRLLKQISVPPLGTFVGPAVIRIRSILELDQEIFGPVMHLATYKASELSSVIDDINATGFGLTFGMHSRIDDRVEKVTKQLNAGNMYINRNQIGAIVGSQPFGGEGLSGTGPKAGGPFYVQRFTDPGSTSGSRGDGPAADAAAVQAMLDSVHVHRGQALKTLALPGPTGESNQLSLYGRGTVLCLGPTLAAARAQAVAAKKSGCVTVIVVPGALEEGGIDGLLAREELAHLNGVDAIALWSDDEDLRAVRKVLAHREGRLVPLLTEKDIEERCILERHICIDTTAAGGNASLLAEAS